MVTGLKLQFSTVNRTSIKTNYSSTESKIKYARDMLTFIMKLC